MTAARIAGLAACLSLIGAAAGAAAMFAYIVATEGWQADAAKAAGDD